MTHCPVVPCVTRNNPMTDTQSDILSLSEVSKTFSTGKRTVAALDQVSFTLTPGQVTGLIGADGAGKTTLMRLAAALFVADLGKVTVLGHDTRTASAAVQASVGYMPQHFGLYEDLTVQENLDLYASLQGVAMDQRQSRYRELMAMTGLTPFTQRLAGKLSGGMKQKLGLACTLVRPPRLLLLDEPTVGVDPVSRRELWEIVYRLVEQEHMTVLLSTAYLDEAERCSEILLMHEGKLLGQGTPDSFSSQLEGRTFVITQPDMAKRALQQTLQTSDSILDAIIVGDGVRVVTRPGQSLQMPPSLQQPELQVQAVPARFEDAFVSQLFDISPPATVAMPAHADTSDTKTRDTAVITVDKVVRKFGDFYAVKGVSFHVQRGEIFGLLGANGAGKSTLFRMLCGLLPVSSGHAEVAGINLRTARAQARARIGYMAQKFSLYVDLTVMQNLQFFAKAYGLRGQQRQTRIDWALENFELQDVAEVSARELPLGFKQRLALAAALMHEPDILFLDEPTSGVDPLARREFWQRINALAESGVTVLVTTHFMEEAEYCDRLVIMAAGDILAEGTPQAIKEKQRSPEHPEPTMEDAFIALIEQHDSAQEQAA